MKEFILTNWKELISVFIGLITLVVCLFRKKGKNDPVADFMYSHIPNIISEIESKIGAGKGELKKSLCMGTISKFYKDITGLDLVVGSHLWNDYSRFVEIILSTPQKKGDKK